MKKDKIIYWTTTGLVSLMLLFGAFSYFTDPMVVEGFKKMGFPDYFRVQLGVAKLIGGLVLLIPQLPTRVKDWAYVGVGINFISALILHIHNGDPVSNMIPLIVLFGILIVSNIYMFKIRTNSAAKVSA